MVKCQHDWIQIDGEYISVVLRKTGSTYYVTGQFRDRFLTGKGRTATEAKSNWRIFAQNEANT